VVDNLVNQVEGQDQQAKSAIKAMVCGAIAGHYIATLKDELGCALEDLGLEPPWSARNSTSGLYRTDEHVIPLAIRLLDGLRLSKASAYADFSESDHLYGCKSPFTDSHLAVNTGLEDKIKKYPKQADQLYQKALDNRLDMKEYVDELTSRLLDLYVVTMATPDEDKERVRIAIHNGLTPLTSRTGGDSLAEIDSKMSIETTRLIDRLMSRLMSRHFSTWSEELTDENVELQIETRSKVEQVFKHFNLEKNAERHLNDCFDLAFCAHASESEKSAARLQALKDNGVTDIPGVLRGTSVDSVQSLYDFNGLSVPELIETAKHAVEISSYGLLKATLDVMNARDVHIAANDWIDMTKDSLSRCEPSIMKQCLHIKDKSGKSLLKDCPEEQQFGLFKVAIDTDAGEPSTRTNEDQSKILLDAIVEKQIAASADLNITDKYGTTPLMYACENGNESVVARLIKAGSKVNATNNKGKTALTYACRQGHEVVVSKLLEAGANINAKDGYGQTALQIACYNGHGDTVTQLVEKNADINATDNSGATALMNACAWGHGDIVSQLIQAGADVDAKDAYGRTALIMACRRDNEAVVTQLIEKNADINAKYGRWGVTALMEACEYGNESVVSKLLEAGADVNAKGSRGKTAFDYAVDNGHDNLADRVIATESTGTRANRIARETGGVLGVPAVLTALAVITTAAMYASGSLDTALESASQAMPDILSAATNVTSQALTELTTAAIEIGRQMGYGPSL
jgi:ankyrin repeat protein